jgi:hypothetical protein
VSATDHGALRSETARTYYEDVVKIPGYGDPPDRCRPLQPVGVCRHGHPVLGRSSCGTRYCPDHWRDWCEDAVISLVARLAAFREAREGLEKRGVHAVASPPQDRRYSVEQLWKTRREAYEAFEAAGVRGGAVATHPYRTTEELDRVFREADTEEGMGKWRFLRELADDLDDGGDEWGEVKRYIVAEPHYHGLGPATDVDGSDAPEGWVVENIRSFDRFHYNDLESYEDMVATAYYVLTHGAVQDGRSTTTYFGELHPSKFDPEEELTLTQWRRIQEMAERAVKGYEDPEEEGDGSGERECPREGCEGRVVEMVNVPDLLADEDWRAKVRTQRDGRKLLRQVRGVVAYWESRTDRPPPSVVTSEARFLEWLERRGRSLTPEPEQSRLSTA